MKIYLGADYRGFEKKQQLIQFLVDKHYEVVDKGAYSYSEGDDYNDPAIDVAQAVRSDRGTIGVLICDSAHGMTIQANRFKGIRAVHCTTPESARLAREHEDANVLCLSAHENSIEQMRQILSDFLQTNFSNIERRVRRINRLDEGENYD